MIELSVIVPTFNEAARIEENLGRVLAKLRALSCSFEIILVNDGSTDETHACLLRLQSPQVKVLSYATNLGKGHAVALGMKNALGKFALFMDADLATSLDAIDPFLNAMRQDQFDIIIGDRQTHRQQRSQPLHRKCLGKIFILLSRLVVEYPIKDFNCGFKIFKTSAAQKIFSYQRINRWGFDVETIAIARAHGYRIGEFDVTWQHPGQSSVRAFRDIFTSLVDLFTIFNNRLHGKYRPDDASHT